MLDAHAELAAARGVSLRRVLAERLVPCDPVLLERLISNLVINAIMYNQPEGWVEVTVAHDGAIHVRPRDGGGLTIEIELPPAH